MEIKTWHEGMSDKETAKLAYWERNMLALRYADGWYNDDEVALGNAGEGHFVPRYQGWRRVLSLEGGKLTFHVPDELDILNLPQIKPNWDGHSTQEKWARVIREGSLIIEVRRALQEKKYDNNIRPIPRWTDWFSGFRFIRKWIGGRWECWYIEPVHADVWFPVYLWSDQVLNLRPGGARGTPTREEYHGKV